MALLFCSIIFIFSLLLGQCFTSFNPPIPRPLQQLITSPEFCFKDTECPLDQFCLGFGIDFLHGGSLDEQGPAKCVPRLSKGSSCYAPRQCEEGTFCGVRDNPAGDRQCLPLLEAGAECLPYNGRNQCQGDLVCIREPICRPFNFGFAGDVCQDSSECQQGKGLGCNTIFKQCTAKSKTGEACYRFVEGVHCEGFCAEHIDPRKRNAFVCQRGRKEGENCTEDIQCPNNEHFPSRSITKEFRCNVQTGGVGTCVLQTDLLKKLGLHCDPKNDKCDARRGLRCAQVSDEHLCIQDGSTSRPYCTPNSPLSTCPPDGKGNPRECRRLLSASNVFGGMFMCRRRRQVVPLGWVCSENEFNVCKAGTFCMVVPGVPEPTTRYFTPRFRTCMKILPIGSRCLDQFRFACEAGSYCVNGTCQQTGIAPDVVVSIFDWNGNCSKVSCAPGTKCVVNDDGQYARCRLLTKKIGLWRSCSKSGLFQPECKEGLQCSRDYRGKGRRICRPKRGFGGICEENDSCEGNLKCDPSHRQWPFHRRCFNASLSLHVGDECNPNGGVNDGRCVAEDYTGSMDIYSPYGSNVVPLDCLAKYSWHACQVPVGLFEKCSPEKNMACKTDDLVCSPFNVCIPASEM